VDKKDYFEFTPLVAWNIARREESGVAKLAEVLGDRFM